MEKWMVDTIHRRIEAIEIDSMLWMRSYMNRLDLLWQKMFGKEYNPDQPRVPAGNPDGGQWTSDGTNGESVMGGSGNDDIIVPKSWNRPEALQNHFDRHGSDFDATSPEDYANQANQFLQTAKDNNLPAVVDKDGNLKVYDPDTNTFAAYNADGTTRTYFKPADGPNYFINEVNGAISGGGSITTPEVPASGGLDVAPGANIIGNPKAPHGMEEPEG